MKIIQGDCGGIDFRLDPASGRSYHFSICQDGNSFLLKYEGHNSNGELLSTPQHNTAIRKGLDQSNLIAIFAERNTIILYINHQRIASTQDNSYTNGNLGLTADEDKKSTEVAYSNARVWTL